jgi:DNA/RNA endonuclease YhcR with UshA esterase domain
MKALVLALGLVLAAIPARAQTIAPADAQKHVGQVVTVEGVVSDVHAAASGRATFIDIGGNYPDNAFAAIIFSGNTSKFPNVDALNGKTVDVTGTVRLYKGKPEIILNEAAQIKAK